jgi:hypothetical protein
MENKNLIVFGIGLFIIAVAYASTRKIKLQEVVGVLPSNDTKSFDASSLPSNLKPPIRLNDGDPIPTPIKKPFTLNLIGAYPRFDIA